MLSVEERGGCQEVAKLNQALCQNCDCEPLFEIGGAKVTLNEMRTHLKRMMRKTIVPKYYLGQWDEFLLDYAMMSKNVRISPECGHPLYQMYLWFVAIIHDDKVMI